MQLLAFLHTVISITQDPLLYFLFPEWHLPGEPSSQTAAVFHTFRELCFRHT